MANKLTTRYKQLSKGGKTGVVAAAIVSLFVFAGVSADDPVISYKNTTETTAIAFSTTYQDDDNLLSSESKVITPGVNGSKQTTYKVTYKGNKETKRDVVNEAVTLQPITQVKAKGTKEIVSEVVTVAIPFASTTTNDGGMSKGTSKVVTVGVNGAKQVTYAVTKVRGHEVSRNVSSEQITTSPVAQVTAVGTKAATVAQPKQASSCDPNYSGGCVPIASDVDCGGGSGNGPAYFYGTARVVGSDIYDLDRDGNGVACQS